MRRHGPATPPRRPSARQQRQLFEPEELGWLHMGRQFLLQVSSERGGRVRRAPCPRNEEGEQSRVSLDPACNHGCVSDFGRLSKNGLDLGRFDPVSQNLDLTILATQRHERPSERFSTMSPVRYTRRCQVSPVLLERTGLNGAVSPDAERHPAALDHQFARLASFTALPASSSNARANPGKGYPAGTRGPSSGSFDVTNHCSSAGASVAP